MDQQEYLHHLNTITNWISNYTNNIGELPVKPSLQPGAIKAQIGSAIPQRAESFDKIFTDFIQIILPGITHWQHPQFFAYFPASNSEPSVLAEMITAAIGAQCMIWYTSPAAEELEEKMMEWIRNSIGLPDSFCGVIQDTASTATLVSLLTAREKFTNWEINENGFGISNKFRIYASAQAHSSVDKAVRIAGFGIKNLVKIPTREDFSLDPTLLRSSIINDLREGFTPLCIVGTFGTTGSTAIDPLAEMGEIAKEFKLWFHVDAAYAGAALILPELRHLAEGIEMADSLVFNPHKWLFTNFDCSAYLIRDKTSLTKTFDILPDYLKTPQDTMVNNYRDWGIQLGRRFRSLKLWFVLRYYGLEGLQELLGNHIHNASWFSHEIQQHPDFELLAPVHFGLVCFRYHPDGLNDEDQLNQLNEKLLNLLNDSGKILLSHTRLNGKYTLRMVAGQVKSSLDHWKQGWNTILSFSASLK